MKVCMCFHNLQGQIVLNVFATELASFSEHSGLALVKFDECTVCLSDLVTIILREIHYLHQS